MHVGYSKHQVLDSFKEVSKDNLNRISYHFGQQFYVAFVVYGQVGAVGRKNALFMVK